MLEILSMDKALSSMKHQFLIELGVATLVIVAACIFVPV